MNINDPYLFKKAETKQNEPEKHIFLQDFKKAQRTEYKMSETRKADIFQGFSAFTYNTSCTRSRVGADQRRPNCFQVAEKQS